MRTALLEPVAVDLRYNTAVLQYCTFLDASLQLDTYMLSL